MGKKLYTKENISKSETERLGIPELVVLKTNRDDVGLEVVHRRYFEDEKLLCPACRSSRTRCSKIVDRKLKDLLWLDGNHKEFKIIDLLYHQRYLRCDNCGQSVFPEPIEFGEKGCKFTNRLSDALADGTFQFSYKKVCQHYGVPASTASVGEIMRRRIQYRESLLPPIRTPRIISIVEVVFFGEFYPAVFGIQNDEDSRILEILFGIPDYKYKVWGVRLLMIYVAIFVILIVFSWLATLLLYPVNLLEMSAQLMFPILFFGNLAFMFSTITRSGNGTAVLMIIIGIALLIFSNTPLIERSFWNILLNPFSIPRNSLPVIWESIIIKSRIFLLVASTIWMLIGLLNLQKREKFV